MELTYRSITPDDWSMLKSWWEGHNWPVPQKDALPDNGTGGIIIEENNIQDLKLPTSNWSKGMYIVKVKGAKAYRNSIITKL